MAGSTFIQLPADVSDAVTLRRFLEKLVLQLDIAFGNRGDADFASGSEVDNMITNISSMQELIDAINELALDYSLIDGSRDYTGIVSYDSDKTFTDDKELIAKKYADDTFEPTFSKNTAFNKNFGATTGTVTEGGTTTNNVEQAAEADLNQTISDPPTQAEVQAISDKVDSILAKLRASDIIST